MKNGNKGKLIGVHKGCGGEVYYHSSFSFAYRVCMKCKQNGMNGTLSPDVE